LPFLLFLISIAFLVFHEAGVLAPVESGLQVVIAPLQRAVSSAVDTVGGLFKTVRDVRELEAQVEELERQRDALLSDNIRLQQNEADVIWLRAMLNFQEENPTWGLMGADVVGQAACLTEPCGDVIGDEPNPYLRYLTINIGSEDGVGMGMPVISGAVLIGRIAEVGLHTSKVQLLNDTGSSVAARLQESRATGTVVGQADDSLHMIYIPQSEEVQVNDYVLTSGLVGGSLPRGLVIGQVAEVMQEDFALHQEAVIRPALDYGQVELVLVITSFPSPLESESAEPEE
jgi:rod shape-determining protein MreC